MYVWSAEHKRRVRGTEQDRRSWPFGSRSCFCFCCCFCCCCCVCLAETERSATRMVPPLLSCADRPGKFHTTSWLDVSLPGTCSLVIFRGVKITPLWREKITLLWREKITPHRGFWREKIAPLWEGENHPLGERKSPPIDVYRNKVCEIPPA